MLEFYAHLAEGLHAMAQPLTILRSIAAATAVPELPEIERLRYLDIAREQVERTCSLFEGLQDLVIAKRHKPSYMQFDLKHLVTTVVTDLKTALDTFDIELNLKLPAEPVLLHGDVAWTRQAAGAALKVAASLCESGDRIELLLEERYGMAELTVQTHRRLDVKLSSLHVLRLALAESSIHSQHGQYQCALDPFCIRLSLPIRNAASAMLRAAPMGHPHSTSIVLSDRNRF
jgi:hypothetical protein